MFRVIASKANEMGERKWTAFVELNGTVLESSFSSLPTTMFWVGLMLNK